MEERSPFFECVLNKTDLNDQTGADQSRDFKANVAEFNASKFALASDSLDSEDDQAKLMKKNPIFSKMQAAWKQNSMS